MSMKKETKIQKILDASQAAEFFYSLGIAIAWADDEKLAKFDLPLGDFDKIKLTIKKDGAAFILKAKVKAADTIPSVEAASGGDIPSGGENTGKPNYKALKKRMKGSFAELKKMLTQDAPPSSETVRRFLDDSYLMTTYPGMGDEHYEQYKNCCQEFEKAFGNGDLEAMRTSLAAVEVRKKACHAQYK
jgi:XXXCH domain-containing protein